MKILNCWWSAKSSQCWICSLHFLEMSRWRLRRLQLLFCLIRPLRVSSSQFNGSHQTCSNSQLLSYWQWHQHFSLETNQYPFSVFYFYLVYFKSHHTRHIGFSFALVCLLLEGCLMDLAPASCTFWSSSTLYWHHYDIVAFHEKIASITFNQHLKYFAQASVFHQFDLVILSSACSF